MNSIKALLTVNALLTITLLVEWHKGSAFPALPVPVPAETGIPTSPSEPWPGFQKPEIATYREVVERPLFSRGRQASPRVGASDEQQAVDGSAIRRRLELSGIIENRIDNRAILFDTERKQSIQVAPNDIIDAWRVVRIDRSGVTLRSGGRQILIQEKQEGTSTE